jgi:hypothetical protein
MAQTLTYNCHPLGGKGKQEHINNGAYKQTS